MVQKKRRKIKTRVAIALSGGVDSGVAAALLTRKSYRVSGFHVHLWSETTKDKAFVNKCCSTESLVAARQTAHQLKIPFYTVNFKKEFKKEVVDYFLKEYSLGQTPNPCVACNRFIKFAKLFDYARKLGYDYLATGHYAQVVKEGNQYCLYQSKDNLKDQTYFLYNLSRKQLTRVLFPVGNFSKKEVVRMAKKWKLPVAERPESQEVCFYPESDYRPFLKRQLGGKIKPGEVVDTKKRVIGKHQGIPLYTVGQRHGFEIGSLKGLRLKSREGDILPPYYVIAKNPEKNQLMVGFGKETETEEFQVKEVNWLARPSRVGKQSEAKIRCLVRIRHQGGLLKCQIEKINGRIKVILKEGERGVAPGQAAVFYQGLKVLGGGIIL